MVVDVLVVGGGVIGVATANACAAARAAGRALRAPRAGLGSVGPQRRPRHGAASRPSWRASPAAASSSGCRCTTRPAAASGSTACRSATSWWPRTRRRSTPSRRSCRAPSGWTPRRCASWSRQLADDLRRRRAGRRRAGASIRPGAVGAMAAEARRFGVADPDGLRGQGADAAPRGAAVTGAVTDAGEIDAGTVVVAAGPWSWRVCRSLGYDVPVRGVRGWIATTRPAPFRAAASRGGLPRRLGPVLGGLRTTVGDLAAGAPPPIHPRRAGAPGSAGPHGARAPR